MLNFHMPKILLTTLNSRYTHTSLSLRYLFANLKELQKDSKIIEFSINDAVQTIAEKLLKHKPDIIGISVYIWNVSEIKDVICVIKKVSPKTIIILGGPEVTHEPFRVNLDNADFVIQGEGEEVFYELCKNILNHKTPKNNIIKALPVSLENIEFPYRYYTDEDIKNRYIYIEASRGCPFGCEFCLSSIDKKVRTFHTDKIIKELEKLWQRGARNFKFIDRTFNLNTKIALRFLDFFLQKKPPYFVHFEVVPDCFSESLKEKMTLFAPSTLQLEIGIQTLNPEIASNISRNLNIDKINENIKFLQTKTHSHLHLDLIVGLPGETLKSFGENLDKLVTLSECEIQIGILKKLSGTTINRHDIKYKMIYSDIPPYDILKNSELSFEDIQIMKRFSRFWNLVYNSGNFKKTAPLIWKDGSVFENFYDFGMWIYTQTDSTYKISFQRLSKLLFVYLTEIKKLPKQTVIQNMLQDITKTKGRAIPPYLCDHCIQTETKISTNTFNKRQKRNLTSNSSIIQF